MLSILLSIIGTWVAAKEIGIEPFQNFLHIWPRNFGIAFWVEMLIAQPIARFAMEKLHALQARKVESIKSANT